MKKNKSIIIVFVIILLLSLISPCLAIQTPETIISYISLNGKAYYDVEILLDKNGKIYLPFKQLSEIFEVSVKTNHSTKDILFETADKKKGIIGKDFIKFDGNTISSAKNFYIKKGLMEDIKDEIFCNEEDLSKIFQATIKTDRNELSLSASTERKLLLLESSEAETVSSSAEPKFKAYTNILTPTKNSKITIDSIGFSNNTMSDTISQYMLQSTQKSMFFNNSTQVLFKGRAFNGDYTVDLDTYNTKGEFFSFGGLGFNYQNNYKGYNYELGKVRGFKNDDYSIGTRILGAQVSNYDNRKKHYRDISGYVAKDSLVKVYVNDKENTTLSTYDGFYSMHNVYLNEIPKTLRLEEVKADGSSNVILNKTYPKYENMPAKGEKKYSVIAGIEGYNNKLLNQNGYIYEMNSKKFVLGTQFEYGIRDDIKLDSKIIYDKILFKPKSSIFENIYSADALLTSGTWKNPNNLEGITNLNNIEYIKNDNLKYKAILGISSSKDLGLMSGEGQHIGYTASASTEYRKDRFTLGASLFNTSPDFYLAGGDGSFVSDRAGASVNFGVSQQDLGLNVNYKKYISNTLNRIEGGFIKFNEYNIGAHKNFGKLFDVKFNINGRDGKNDFAHNRSYYYDLNFSKKFKDSISLQAGKNESNYQTTYEYQSAGQSDFKSLFSTIYAKADYTLPKNLGKLLLGHDIVNYSYNSDDNKYNMMKIGYTFPEIKRITVSLGTGYKYQGTDKGFDFSANFAYRCKSGRVVNFNYQFNRNGGIICNNMYMPMSARHSVNLVLNDAFAVLPSGLKSVGYNDDNRGFVEIIAYIDKNKNGKYDKEDIGVQAVPVNCSWEGGALYTNKKGRVIPAGTEKGIYKVKLDFNKLPATLVAEKNQVMEKTVRISAHQTTRVEFPIKSCVGNISGKLKIMDDFGRNLNIKDFVITLNDEKGEEVAYSTVDDDGSFYMSGIAPGKYTVQLDKSFIENNNLQDCGVKSTLNVDIPYVYKEFIDVKDLNLVYKTLSI